VVGRQRREAELTRIRVAPFKLEFGRDWGQAEIKKDNVF
jgi:hypothetical protein